ncbi:glutamine synthetase cytosolic isozyme 2-like [Neltuma alba]|uniref:glutamine synthetase cytosolic isozyme 2-like n=1 Tax=Neltuma alba TaxID=207710 RepID=UPI0010A3DF55|nr:glutamine synthetase cytosolic isozyme 2-like [Prosopis alba]
MLVSFEPDAILQTTSNEADTPIWLSTLSMRKVGGYEDSQFKVLKLMMKHMDDIAARDEGNGLEGIWVLRTVFQFFPIYETSTGASGAKKALSGYVIVDWRRAANMDPYEVTSKILETSILWKPTLWEILVARLAMIPFPGWVKRIFRHFVC